MITNNFKSKEEPRLTDVPEIEDLYDILANFEETKNFISAMPKKAEGTEDKIEKLDKEAREIQKEIEKRKSKDLEKELEKRLENTYEVDSTGFNSNISIKYPEDGPKISIGVNFDEYRLIANFDRSNEFELDDVGALGDIGRKLKKRDNDMDQIIEDTFKKNYPDVFEEEFSIDVAEEELNRRDATYQVFITDDTQVIVDAVTNLEDYNHKVNYWMEGEIYEKDPIPEKPFLG